MWRYFRSAQALSGIQSLCDVVASLMRTNNVHLLVLDEERDCPASKHIPTKAAFLSFLFPRRLSPTLPGQQCMPCIFAPRLQVSPLRAVAEREKAPRGANAPAAAELFHLRTKNFPPFAK